MVSFEQRSEETIEGSNRHGIRLCHGSWFQSISTRNIIFEISRRFIRYHCARTCPVLQRYWRGQARPRTSRQILRIYRRSSRRTQSLRKFFFKIHLQKISDIFFFMIHFKVVSDVFSWRYIRKCSRKYFLCRRTENTVSRNSRITSENGSAMFSVLEKGPSPGGAPRTIFAFSQGFHHISQIIFIPPIIIAH